MPTDACHDNIHRRRSRGEPPAVAGHRQGERHVAGDDQYRDTVRGTGVDCFKFESAPDGTPWKHLAAATLMMKLDGRGKKGDRYGFNRDGGLSARSKRFVLRTRWDELRQERQEKLPQTPEHPGGTRNGDGNY